MAYSKTYVVWEGRHPGIYSSWEDCKAEVENFPNARYKAFSSRTEAIMAYRESDREASEVLRSISRHLKEESAGYMSNPEINPESIAVDAGCSGNPGKMEYRGVYLPTGKQIFHYGPVYGTNNIGEFLAIVHALALLKQKGLDMPVYSDSVNAISWVKQKKCKTKLPREPRTEQLFQLIERAEKWLHENTYTTRILKWETHLWGEVPADFGRK